MTTSIINPKSVEHGTELRLDTLIEGLQTAIPAGITSLPVRGAGTKIADCVTQAQALVAPWKTVRVARTTISGVMVNRTGDQEAARVFLTDMKTALSAVLGVDNQALAAFGFKPKKPTPTLTPAEKVLRAAKAKLTRQKRNTMGSRQKAALRTTGTPVVTIGPDGTLIAPPISTPATTLPTTSK